MEITVNISHVQGKFVVDVTYTVVVSFDRTFNFEKYSRHFNERGAARDHTSNANYAGRCSSHNAFFTFDDPGVK